MKRIIFTCVISIIASSAAITQDAIGIVREMDKRSDNGPGTMTMAMDIMAKESNPSDLRRFELIIREKDENASYIEFLKPRSAGGLKILTLGKESWVFFPSTGRVRKLAGGDRGDSVQGIGGDFSYEDLSFGDWEERYSFTLVSTTTTTWVLEGRAKDPGVTYVKTVTTVLRDTYRPARIEFYDATGLLKTLDFSGYKLYSGRLEAETMVMRNVRKNSRTTVTVLNIVFESAFDERFFEPNRFYK